MSVFEGRVAVWLAVAAVVAIGAVSGVVGLFVGQPTRVEVREVLVEVEQEAPEQSPVTPETTNGASDGGQEPNGPVAPETGSQSGSEDLSVTDVRALVLERCGVEPSSSGVDRIYWRACRRDLLEGLI